MATFTGTNSVDIAHGLLGLLSGFTGGTVAELQDGVGDTFLCDQDDDFVSAGAGTDLIRGQRGADYLNGGGGVDTIEGGVGDDTLVGGSGNDSLVGGDGDDTYLIDSQSDIIIEDSILAVSGIDTVETSLSVLTLTWANVEDLVYTGTGNFTGTGNDLYNSITGGSGSDTLTGGLNNDTLIGGLGNDVFLFNSPSDIVTEELIDGGDDYDTIRIDFSGTYDFTRASIYRIESLLFTNNVSLSAAKFYGSGISSLVSVTGSSASNIFYVNVFTGPVLDLSLVTFSNWTAGQDSVELVGSGSIAETIIGSSVDDRIVAGGGADSVFGSLGNDIIAFVNSNDLVVGETIDGGQGTDTIEVTNGGNYDFSTVNISGVETFMTYQDDASVVTFTFASSQVGAGRIATFDGAEAGPALLTFNIVGGSVDMSMVTFANWSNVTAFFNLSGSGATDTIVGTIYADTITGGAGADALNGGANFDFASYATSIAGITARLDYSSLNTGDAAGDTYTAIEGLIGSVYNDFLVGATGGDYLTAQGGDDYLAGEGGNDTIRGDGGQDHLWGGEGADAA
jgi:serralysin